MQAYSQTHHSKLSQLHKVNEQKPLAVATKASEKVGVGNKVRDAGKENNAGEIPLSQKCSGKGKAAEGMVAGRKGTTQSTSAKGGKTGMVVPKVLSWLQMIWLHVMIFISSSILAHLYSSMVYYFSL